MTESLMRDDLSSSAPFDVSVRDAKESITGLFVMTWIFDPENLRVKYPGEILGLVRVAKCTKA